RRRTSRRRFGTRGETAMWGNPPTSRTRAGARALAAAGLVLVGAPALAQQVMMETLLDRIQIEDLLTRYYYDLARGDHDALAEYFTEDALLDVDGTVARGHEEIAKLYERPDSERDSG